MTHSHASVSPMRLTERIERRLAFWRHLPPRLVRLTFPLLVRILGEDAFCLLPKVVTHDHWDCDNDAETVLILLWRRRKFAPLPQSVVTELNRITIDPHLPLEQLIPAVKQDARFQKAMVAYRDFIVQEPGKVDLGKYVDLIAKHNVAVMQTDEELRLFARQRFARRTGEVGLVWRGAVPYHTAEGLSDQDVVRILADEAAKAPFPVVLELCALRHEAKVPTMTDRAARMADLAIAFPDSVGYTDLAADEANFDDDEVWRWYFIDAVRAWAVRLSMGKPVIIDMHHAETGPTTEHAQDKLARVERLMRTLANNMAELAVNPDAPVGLVAGVDQLFVPFVVNEQTIGPLDDQERARFIEAEELIRRNIRRRSFHYDLGGDGRPQPVFMQLHMSHGIQDAVSNRPRSMCPCSNVYIGASRNVDEHPIGRLWAMGKRITLGCDGMDPLDIKHASQDYSRLWFSKHRFRLGHFKRIAWEAYRSFNGTFEQRRRVRKALLEFYGEE